MDALLLSGGMDSTAVAAWIRPPLAITINYGQMSAAGEIRASMEIAALFNMRHEIVTVDCRSIGSGDLAGKAPHSLAPESEWWPFRNQLLITLAVMRGISLGITKLVTGTVKSDCFHADGSAPFIRAISDLCVLQEGAIRIEAPACGMTSTELIRASRINRSDLAWAHSCHKGDYACGLCRGCNKHRLVMAELGYDEY